MPSVKQRFIFSVANLTAFLRFEVGLVRGREPQETVPAREKRLRRQVKQLQATLRDSQRQLDKAKWQLGLPALSMPRRWRWAAYIVSDKHRFVFLATHKVASTSILLSLLPLFDFDEVQGKNFEDFEWGPTFERNDVPIGDVHKLFISEGSQINKAQFLANMGSKYHSYFKFAFVRNPWDRLVSCYLSKVVQGGRGMHIGEYGDVTLRKEMTFEEFAYAVCRIPDEVANTHFRSQYVTVCDDGPKKTVLADFVGRLETLDEDFRFVAERIGLTANLSHTGSTRSKHSLSYRDFYDERLAQAVGERYHEDVGLFGYSF
jgi:hypothetical protein